MNGCGKCQACPMRIETRRNMRKRHGTALQPRNRGCSISMDIKATPGCIQMEQRQSHVLQPRCMVRTAEVSNWRSAILSLFKCLPLAVIPSNDGFATNSAAQQCQTLMPRKGRSSHQSTVDRILFVSSRERDRCIPMPVLSVGSYNNALDTGAGC